MMKLKIVVAIALVVGLIALSLYLKRWLGLPRLLMLIAVIVVKIIRALRRSKRTELLWFLRSKVEPKSNTSGPYR